MSEVQEFGLFILRISYFGSFLLQQLIGQCEMERTSLSRFRFYPNGTAMQLYYFLAVRQPNA